MLGRQLNSFQCSVLGSSQEEKEEPEQEERLRSPGLEGGLVPSSSQERCWSNPTSSALSSAPNGPVGLLLVARGCKASLIPSLLCQDNP